jgi:hypothetical protein
MMVGSKAGLVATRAGSRAAGATTALGSHMGAMEGGSMGTETSGGSTRRAVHAADRGRCLCTLAVGSPCCSQLAATLATPCNIQTKKQALISAPAVWVAVFTPCL